jgi:hypothetical protein
MQNMPNGIGNNIVYKTKIKYIVSIIIMLSPPNSSTPHLFSKELHQ